MQKELLIPIYEATVSISVSNDIKVAIKHLNTLYEIDEELVDAAGLVNNKISKKYGARIHYMLVAYNISKKEYMNTIAHELMHLTQDILEKKQIYFKRGDANEAYAYLQGWLMAESYEFFEKAYNKFKRVKSKV